MIRRCRFCGRKLRSKVWRAVGFGPVCARRMGLVLSRQAAVAVPVRPAPVVEVGDDQLALFEITEEGAA